MASKPNSSLALNPTSGEEYAGKDRNTLMLIDVMQCGEESNVKLLEDYEEAELPVFEEVCVHGSDSSYSSFDLGLVDGVHSPEGSIDYDNHDISTWVKSDVENIVSVSEEVREESGELPSSFGLKSGSNGDFPEVNLAQTKPIELELIHDVKTSHFALEEPIDTDGGESSMKVSEVFTDPGSKTIVNDAKASENEASYHAAEKESETTLNRCIFSPKSMAIVSSIAILGHIIRLYRKGISTAGYRLVSGAFVLPHPDKVSSGGEDAYFIAGKNWIGVADGVGEWSERGIDAGIYARELMENCEKIVSDSDSIPLTNPEEVIIRSALKAHSPGSSTISVGYCDGQALHIANIGDSGFIVIRNGTVHQKTSPRFFEFNCPYQIKSGEDPLELVERYRIDLEEGDVIITATDGLFDNLYEQEIVSIVNDLLESNLGPKEIAEVLAMRAQELGKSENCRTPFGDAVEAAGYTGFTGGKLDDVTVIVSFVKRQ